MSIARTRFGFALRALLVVVLAGAGLSTVTAAQAQPLAAPTAAVVTGASPVGTWAVTVTIEGVPPFPATFQFTPNNVAFVAGRGSGVWYSTGTNTFGFVVAEGLFTPENVYVGWIRVEQSPTLGSSGTTFTSSGVSTVYDTADAVTQTANVTMTATKVA
ncbi:MAG TPA: hypothetical protein VFC19_20920 [Candidatus Limnocylindrales bacterium]|nr:hypothetical protein [Candidatus Limnocylindrales bacterium]